MSEFCNCSKYMSPHWRQEDCPQLRAIVPARMPEQSHVERSGSPSVPGDSRMRKIRTVAEKLSFAIEDRNWPRAHILNKELYELCSEES